MPFQAPSEFNPIRRQPRGVTARPQPAQQNVGRQKALLPGLGQPQNVPQPQQIQPQQQAAAQPVQPAQARNPLSGLQTGGTRTDPTINGQPVPSGPPPIPGVQPVAQPTPGISTFTAEDNLRNKQINPGGDPSRGALAQDAFNLIREDSDTQFDQDIRKVGQNAAKFGRIGSGLTTSDLGDVSQRRNEFLGRAQRDLANRAAGDEIGDRRSDRGELRGERTFQDTLAQRSIDNARNQTLDEDALQNSEFGRKQDVNDFLLRAGQGNNSNDLLGATDLLPEGVSTAEFLREAALRRAQQQRQPQN